MDCSDFEEVKLKFDVEWEAKLKFDLAEEWLAKLKFEICNSPSRSAKGMDCGVSFLSEVLAELFSGRQ